MFGAVPGWPRRKMGCLNHDRCFWFGHWVRVIDSSTGVPHSLCNLIERDVAFSKRLKREECYRFFVSDTTAQFEATARSILRRRIHLETLAG